MLKFCKEEKDMTAQKHIEKKYILEILAKEYIQITKFLK